MFKLKTLYGRAVAHDEVYELSPTNGRQSFYGKAHVAMLPNGAKILKSYDTLVAYVDADKKFHRLWDGWSATTGSHLQSFYPGMKKSVWDKLEVEEL